MRVLLVAALALSSCHREGTRDAVVTKLDRPLALTVRRHEVRSKPRCRETGLYSYKCWLLPPDVRGCLYLDIGPPPVEAQGTDPCHRFSSERKFVGQPTQAVDLVADDTGSRFAWRTQLAWHIGYVFEGVAIVPLQTSDPPNSTAKKDTTPIDWSAQPTLDDELPSLYFVAEPTQQLGLLARLRERRGEDGVEELLHDPGDVLKPGWESAFATLDEGRQKKVASALAQHGFDDDSSDALDWLDAHPGLAPSDLEQRFTARAKAALDSGDQVALDRWLERAHRKANPEAGAVACRLLEWKAVQNTWSSVTRGGWPGTDDSPLSTTPFAVLASTHTRCAAAVAVLSENPCATGLRCNHRLRDSETARQESAPEELCDAVDAEKVARALHDPEQVFHEYDGAAKMGALLANGPLPKAFALANARRGYTLLRPEFTLNPDGDPESPCVAGRELVADFVCALSPEQTRFELNRCRVEIDDEKKTVRLTSLGEVDGGL